MLYCWEYKLRNYCSLQKHTVWKILLPRSWAQDWFDWFVFAHALGLYNIGVCDVQFAIENSKKWVGIRNLDKETSIRLEHSRGEVEIQKKKVFGLRNFTNFTLSQANSEDGVKDFNELDFHSIVAMREDTQTKTKHVVFIGSLGIYKFTHAPGSFLLPIWVGPYAPKNEEEFAALSNNVHIQQNEWVRALVPYVPAKIMCEDEIDWNTLKETNSTTKQTKNVKVIKTTKTTKTTTKPVWMEVVST